MAEEKSQRIIRNKNDEPVLFVCEGQNTFTVCPMDGNRKAIEYMNEYSNVHKHEVLSFFAKKMGVNI